MLLLADKKMLVTGGSRGIGAGIVRTAMEEGAEVAFVYQHNSEAADALVSEMTASHPGQRCLAFQCDIADTEKSRELAKSVVAAFGRLDALVNNAGITRDVALGRMRREQWDAVMAINLGGLFNVTQPLLMQLVRQRAGSIINMTSYAGVNGSKSQTNYSASKGGIIAFTKSLSKEVAEHGVRVNAVAPGFIATEMVAMLTDERTEFLKSQIPIGRFGTPEDVANLVCFLASDRSSYITGQILQIDGGLVL